MKTSKNIFLFAATLILVVFSGCSSPEQTRAMDSVAIASESSPSPSLSLQANSSPIAAKQNNKSLDCLDTDQTQLEMNQCAGNAAREANEKLNRAYTKLQEKVAGSPQEQRLKTAQSTWLAFREADCDYAQKRYDGGSIMPMIYALCVVDLTEKRTQTLENYLQEY